MNVDGSVPKQRRPRTDIPASEQKGSRFVRPSSPAARRRTALAGTTAAPAALTLNGAACTLV